MYDGLCSSARQRLTDLVCAAAYNPLIWDVYNNAHTVGRHLQRSHAHVQRNDEL